ncbi:protein N-terminal glutamine amidohydrolase [Galendromus occidentalis]|uniref:Protein N-terminal glutamine amidohydrolase n=1 Tax=Galendromus occidentalis TaxID=34638 RepID=A0AAJ7P993_9ACAR|nr:protein N-terminal glutamine amidohydrolase [Galendromus occidentalis]
MEADIVPSPRFLKLPPRSDLIYTSCYCEENVYKLCEYVKNNEPELLSSCFVTFISNKYQSIPLWRQTAGDKNNDGFVVWDYHVILVYYHESCQGKSYVYDLDSTMDFPADLEEYVWKTFKPDVPLKHCYVRHLRCLGGRDYLATFASNRQRMKRPDGSWIKPPPSYPPIMNSISANNLEWFIDMQAGNGVPGVVLNQFNFCKQFNIHLDKMFEDS